MDRFLYGFYAVINSDLDMWNIKIYYNDKFKKYKADIETFSFGEDTTIKSDTLIDCLLKVVNHVEYHYSFRNKVTFISEAIKYGYLNVSSHEEEIKKFLKNFKIDAKYVYNNNKGTAFLIYYYTWIFNNDLLGSTSGRNKFYKVRNYLREHKYNI